MFNLVIKINTMLIAAILQGKSKNKQYATVNRMFINVSAVFRSSVVYSFYLVFLWFCSRP